VTTKFKKKKEVDNATKAKKRNKQIKIGQAENKEESASRRAK
jgi:hypothetical protein